jgi:hypothetical protein
MELPIRKLAPLAAATGLMLLVVLLLACPAWALALPEAPLTEAASEVTATSATLNGVLNPAKKAKAGYHFDYSSSGTCTGNSTEAVAEATVKALDVSAVVTNLTAHTIYTFCLVATNKAGETVGEAQTFETLSPPLVEEESASGVTQTSAAVSALVNPESQETRCIAFQYVGQQAFQESGYASAREALCEPEELGSGSSGEGVGARISGLSPDSVYHYRVLAENESGQVEGEDHQLLTLPNPPLAITDEASAITSTSAVLSGTVYPGGTGAAYDTSLFFEYGVSESYGSKTAVQEVGSGEMPLTQPASLTGLAPGTTYHYRIVATNNIGGQAGAPQTIAGDDRTFTTAGAQSQPAGALTSSESGATVTATLTLTPPPTPPALPQSLVSFPAEAPATGVLATKATHRPSAGQALARALRACHKKPKRQRARCERQARRQQRK